MILTVGLALQVPSQLHSPADDIQGRRAGRQAGGRAEADRGAEGLKGVQLIKPGGIRASTRAGIQEQGRRAH